MADQTFAVHCGFFDAINSDRTYSADEMNRPYKRVISNGVFATPNGTPSTDLQVTASSGMNIICKKGEGLFGDKWFENPSGIAITVPSNTGTVPRIDSVLVQVDTRTSGRVGNIVHRTGTPASSPVPPAINQVEGVIEYRLANIRVNAGVSAITQSMITDRRGSSDCPWVTSLIYQVDTSTLYDQWQAAYAEYFEEEKAIWDAWYAQLTEDLDVSMTLDRHTNTVTTTAQTTGYIPIGLAYNHNTDILEVYINGLRAVEGTHYVVVDDTTILVENQLQIGQTVTFVVMRSVISGDATSIMTIIQSLQDQIAGIAGGTPTVVDAKADMTDTEKIYILSSDSKWYYYSPTAADWQAGGTYGGVPTDTTLSERGRAADAEATGNAINAVSDSVYTLSNRLSEYADIFTADVDESVQNWLDEHPEATTTVQDGSLTDVKFSNALKLATIKDYVTPEMYGAVADDSTDCASAFESALNSGKPVFVPPGTYYISRPLQNPTKFVLIGSGKYVSNIRVGDDIFANAMTNSIVTDIYFYCNQTNDITAFPATVTNSIISKCSFQFFKRIFYRVTQCTHITKNRFGFIQEHFCNAIVDSFVTENYINAPKLKNPQTVCFAGSIIHTVVANNFIDYMYKVFAIDSISNISHVTVTGNIFDVCYCIFYNCVKNVTFTGNTLSNLTKRSDWDVSDNEEMDTKPWCVIKRLTSTSPLVSSYFGGNTFDDDFDMYLYCDTYGYPTKDLIIDELLASDKFDYKAYKSNTPRDFENIKIRPMLKRTVETLPTPSLSGSRATFNFDEVIYNGNLYMNINGTWVQITGTQTSN